MIDRKNNQEIGNVDNSTINQACRDVVNNYNGLQVTDIVPLVNTLVESKLSVYAAQAKVTAIERANDFGQLLEKMVEEKVADKIERFNEPSIQMAARKAALGYVMSGDKEQEDNSIDLLIERIKTDEHTTQQNLIDEAIDVLPKLSKETLTLLILIAYQNLTYNGSREMLIKWFKCVSPMLETAIHITPLDISYLQQTGCAFGITGIYSHDKFEEKYLKSNSYFFKHSISGQEYVDFWESFGFIVNDIAITGPIEDFTKLINIFKTNPIKKEVSLNITSPQVFEQAYQDPFLSSHKDIILNAIQRFPSFSKDEVRQYFLDIDSNWGPTIDLLNRDEVRALNATPVGNYIASRQLSKLSELDIGLDVFYHN